MWCKYHNSRQWCKYMMLNQKFKKTHWKAFYSWVRRLDKKAFVPITGFGATRNKLDIYVYQESDVDRTQDTKRKILQQCAIYFGNIKVFIICSVSAMWCRDNNLTGITISSSRKRANEMIKTPCISNVMLYYFF